MCDNLHISRSMSERLKYENNEDLIYDTYTERIIDDQEIFIGIIKRRDIIDYFYNKIKA